MPDLFLDEEFYASWRDFTVKFNEKLIKSLRLVGPEHDGKVSKTPWSGYWWPMLDGPADNLYDSGGPLEKYDNYVKAKTGLSPNAVSWEKKNHYTNDVQNSWWGHCNGWAAAAVLEKEPTKPKTKGNIAFTVGDQKGLMSEAHWYDAADLDQKIGSKAHVFHKILLDWVGKGKTSVIMDVSFGSQVWNYPVVQYKMDYVKDNTDPNKTHVTCTIWFADDAVDPDYVGTKSYYSEFGRIYTYWLSGDISRPTDGEWEGTSVYDHPDLIWHPVFVETGNHGAFGYGKPTWLIDILS